MSVVVFSAKQVEACHRPGHYAHRFVEPYLDRAPQYYLVKSYRKLSWRWEHMAELEGRDCIQQAETIFEEEYLVGDCEDFAVCMMAICRYRGLHARYGLGRSMTDSNSGHVWIEVAISPSDERDKKLEKHLTALDSHLRIVESRGMKWLRFSDKPIDSLYRVTHYVDASGNLKKAKLALQADKHNYK